MKDYRVTIKVRNNRILTEIVKSGGEPGPKWCEKNGLPYVGVNDLINMTTSPLKASGELSKTAAELCDVLCCAPDDLWSNEQIRPLEKNFSELEMSHSQVVAMLPLGEQSYLHDFTGIEDEEAKTIVAGQLGTLSARTADMLRKRYFDERTFESIAKEYGITDQRARQIIEKGMRALRHPARANVLRDLLPETVGQRKALDYGWSSDAN